MAVRDHARAEMARSLSGLRWAFLGVGMLSGVLNLLMLTGALFMLEVYDRVLPSRSLPTLVALVAIVIVLYGFLALLDLLRGRLLVRIGAALDQAASARVFSAVMRQPLERRTVGDGLQPLRDLEQVRSFIAGGGPAVFFDLPWIPLYLGLCFLFHPWIGVSALAGGLVLVGLALLTDTLTRAPTEQAAAFNGRRLALAANGRRNAEVLRAMGMGPRLLALQGEANARCLAAQQRTADVGGGIGAFSRALRLFLQSAVLAVGAWLVIRNEATAGVIVASAVLTGRALAPVEQAIGSWRSFVAARQGWGRLNELLAGLPVEAAPLALPRPTRILVLEGVGVAPPGETRLVAEGISFSLGGGAGLGIIGPSASGKSSLARAIVGVWRPACGMIRLDGATLDQWTPEELGRHIGYLPQDVELFDGTVAENIARLEAEPDAAAVIAAAQRAGVHDLILRLPAGYQTRVGEGGQALSAGQRQRIALARALYREPFLVVLDEPNSNLDSDGEEALAAAMAAVRGRGGIVVVIAHRPGALAQVDHVLMMENGRIRAFGAKDEVLRRVLRPTSVALRLAGD